MLVYMMETRRGSPDGFVVKRYREGHTYDLPDNLAKMFLKNNWGLELAEEDIIGFEGMHPANRRTLSTAEILDKLPNKYMRGFNSAKEAMVAFSTGAGACQIREFKS